MQKYVEDIANLTDNALQLELFSETELNPKIKDRIQHFQKLIDKSGHDWELVAVNKMYESVVVHIPGGQLYTAIERNGFINCEYIANDQDGFGTNLLILKKSFIDYESITLEKGNQLIGCNVKNLKEYLAEGWKVNCRGGVMLI